MHTHDNFKLGCSTPLMVEKVMLDKRIFLSDYRTFRQQRGHLSLWNYASENHTEKLE